MNDIFLFLNIRKIKIDNKAADIENKTELKIYKLFSHTLRLNVFINNHGKKYPAGEKEV